MLEKIGHIEGLEQEAFANVEMVNDTPPNITRIWFDTVLTEMPALSEKEGRVIKKPFVNLFWEGDLGNFAGRRRIKDLVELNEETGKWIVKKLYKDPNRSDILKNQDAWNAFARGQTYEAVGTPLSVLFRNDPARVDKYKFYHLSTVEQVAAIPDGQLQTLGMGAMDDRAKAKAFLAKTQGNGAVLTLNRELEEERAQRKALENVVADLTEKLTQVLESQLAEKPRATRSKPKSTEVSVGA